MASDQIEQLVSRQRVDKWLFFAHVVKTRSLAQKLVKNGKVKLNGGRVERASLEICAGDRVEVVLERRDVHLVVREMGYRRGPFSEAQLLYEDVSPPPEARKSYSAFEQAQRIAGSGRPTKKERRALMRFREDD